MLPVRECGTSIVDIKWMVWKQNPAQVTHSQDAMQFDHALTWFPGSWRSSPCSWGFLVSAAGTCSCRSCSTRTPTGRPPWEFQHWQRRPLHRHGRVGYFSSTPGRRKKKNKQCFVRTSPMTFSLKASQSIPHTVQKGFIGPKYMHSDIICKKVSLRLVNVDKMVMNGFYSSFIESELLPWSGSLSLKDKNKLSHPMRVSQRSSTWASTFPLSLPSESLRRLMRFSHIPSSHCTPISRYTNQDTGSAIHGGALKGTLSFNPSTIRFLK